MALLARFLTFHIWVFQIPWGWALILGWILCLSGSFDLWALVFIAILVITIMLLLVPDVISQFFQSGNNGLMIRQRSKLN